MNKGLKNSIVGFGITMGCALVIYLLLIFVFRLSCSGWYILGGSLLGVCLWYMHYMGYKSGKAEPKTRFVDGIMIVNNNFDPPIAEISHLSDPDGNLLNEDGYITFKVIQSKPITEKENNNVREINKDDVRS